MVKKEKGITAPPPNIYQAVIDKWVNSCADTNKDCYKCSDEWLCRAIYGVLCGWGESFWAKKVVRKVVEKKDEV